MSEITWDPDNYRDCQQACRICTNITSENVYIAFQDGKSVIRLDPKVGHVRFEKKPTRYDRLMEEVDQWK